MTAGFKLSEQRLSALFFFNWQSVRFWFIVSTLTSFLTAHT